jgi:hypothetical protein
VVNITEESTNTVLKTVTGESGDYIVNYLKPGSYRAEFAAPGFKEHVETGIPLQINQSRRVDPILEVGQVSEKIQVSATAAQVNYVSPEIGQVVDAEQLVELPQVATNSRGGGVMIATSRAGGNVVHGSAYDLFRNRLLNGRDFFLPAQSTVKYVQNDPGGTVGGPVVIPHVYNGKDKTFFFVDFNVTLASQGNVFQGIVPTDMQRSGNFSQTFAGGQDSAQPDAEPRHYDDHISNFRLAALAGRIGPDPSRGRHRPPGRAFASSREHAAGL